MLGVDDSNKKSKLKKNDKIENSRNKNIMFLSKITLSVAIFHGFALGIVFNAIECDVITLIVSFFIILYCFINLKQCYNVNYYFIIVFIMRIITYLGLISFNFSIAQSVLKDEANTHFTMG